MKHGEVIVNKLLPGYFDVLARLDDFKVVRLDESFDPILKSTQPQISKVVPSGLVVCQ